MPQCTPTHYKKKSAELFLYLTVSFYIPTSNKPVIIFSVFVLPFGDISILYFSHLVDTDIILWFSYAIPLMANDIEHLRANFSSVLSCLLTSFFSYKNKVPQMTMYLYMSFFV
jgi:hypothetical protein